MADPVDKAVDKALAFTKFLYNRAAGFDVSINKKARGVITSRRLNTGGMFLAASDLREEAHRSVSELNEYGSFSRPRRKFKRV